MKSVILVLALVAGVAQAQTVYKCQDGYQDTPCAAAQTRTAAALERIQKYGVTTYRGR